ncbi:hypothetical protein G3578_17280 [Brevibacillus sp. SYP-B805]|uniref:hypothetical protein n=1 Tax=Brevibacillus sp. SYP-B805 TaxID=1578199 RepID=UPI0013EAC648|nr:hypothetical protein [Brevibacillus sp. SYP-B805]NGQ96917.1 hypothetical protein [Brevibacillus sp. SYP-B805]
MQIQTDKGYISLNLYAQARKETEMVAGSIPELAHQDTVELRSAVPRQLPDGVIQHETPKFFFNSEINASLDKILAEKAPEVKKAAYGIIEFNLFATNRDLSDDERAALLEAGLSQAKYLADHYMTDDEASEFLATINLLGAVAKTRKVDPATGNVTYIELPQKPQGAPSDYVNIQKVMQRYDPKAYASLQSAVATGGNVGGILIEFAKKLRQHPEWVREYRQEQDRLMTDLRNTKIDNRFEGVNTIDMETFATEMKERAEHSSLKNIDVLTQNIASFARLLGCSV